MGILTGVVATIRPIVQVIRRMDVRRTTVLPDIPPVTVRLPEAEDRRVAVRRILRVTGVLRINRASREILAVEDRQAAVTLAIQVEEDRLVVVTQAIRAAEDHPEVATPATLAAAIPETRVAAVLLAVETRGIPAAVDRQVEEILRFSRSRIQASRVETRRSSPRRGPSPARSRIAAIRSRQSPQVPRFSRRRSRVRCRPEAGTRALAAIRA